MRRNPPIRRARMVAIMILSGSLLSGLIPPSVGKGEAYPFPGFHGYVKDANGYAIPSATVTANPGSHSTSTNSNGWYILSVGEEGGYFNVTASKTGFNDYTYNNVYTSDEWTTLLSFTLSPKNDASDNDGEGLSNYYEVNTAQTNPHDADTDDDGLNDYAEVNTYGTNPKDSDTDDDGLNDYAEVNTYGSNPVDSDTDDDGYGDGKETEMNYDGAGHVTSKDLYAEVDKDSDVSWPSSSVWTEVKSDFQAKGIYVHILTDQASLGFDGNESLTDLLADSGDGYDDWTDSTYKSLYFVHLILIDWIDGGTKGGYCGQRTSGSQRSSTCWVAKGYFEDKSWSDINCADVISHELGHAINTIHNGDPYSIMYLESYKGMPDRSFLANETAFDPNGRYPEKWRTTGDVLI